MLLFLLSLLTLTQADGKKAEEGKSIGYYKKELINYEKISKNLYNESFYKSWKFIHKATGEVKSIKDFNEFDRNLIFLFAGEKLTHELNSLHEGWASALKNSKPGRPDKDGDEDIASKEDLQKFCSQMFELRKQTAVRYESFVERLYKGYPDKFTREEKNFYLNRMREFHDKHKLVDRAAK